MCAVQRTVHPIDGELLSVCTVRADPEADRRYGVLIMHGAGTGSKERNLPLAEDFASLGHTVAALDFSGHGESSGELRDLNLRRRRDQAAGVIEEVFGTDVPLVLVGFSMSGQTVADLIELYGERVAAIVLCAPGIYARDAWDVAFGAGFTESIRRPESWRTSPAPDAYARFDGRALLVQPEQDAVIPAGVTALITSALSTKADFSTLRLMGANHRLGLWLADHPQDRQRIVNTLLRQRGSARVSTGELRER